MKPIRPGKKANRIDDTQLSSGFPSPAEDYEEPPLDLHDLLVKNPPATYFMRVETDTMNRAGISRGDVVVVDRSLKAKPGQLVVAVLEDQFVVRWLSEASASGISLADDEQTVESDPAVIWGVITYIVHRADRQ